MLKLEGHSDEEFDPLNDDEEVRDQRKADENDEEESKEVVVNVKGSSKVVFFGRNN